VIFLFVSEQCSVINCVNKNRIQEQGVAMGFRAVFGASVGKLGIAAAIAAFGGSLAFGSEAATDQTPSSAESAGTGSLDEIIVTAQRRAQNLEKVPIAVTVISPTTIEKADIRNVLDLQEVTPALTFNSSFGFANTYIRGVGSALATPGLEPAVATYVDGAYVPRANGTFFELLDPGTIEVLKGPQGTLYGRNASGGAILLTSADPTHELAGYASEEYGNFNHHQSDLVLNLPASETLAFRFAARYYNQDGYLNNFAPGGGALGSRNGYVVRGKAKWDPTDDLSVVFTAEYSYDNSQRDPTQAGVTTAPLCFVCAAYGQPVATGKYNVSNDFPAPFVTYSRSENLKVTYKAGDLSFQSISAYRNMFGTTTADDDYSTLPLDVFDSGYGGKTFTEDLQVASSFPGMFNFLAGIQYMHDDANSVASVYGTLFGIPYTVGEPIDRNDLPSAWQTVTTNSYAGFAEAYIKPVDRLTITLGGRYTHDSRDLVSTESPLGVLIFTGGLGAAAWTQSATFTKFTPRAVVAYDLDAVNLYASFTRGFKAGGFNTPAFSEQPDIKPETIDSYEIGAKYVSSDRRVRVNVAAFHYTYDDLQVSVVNLNTGGQNIVNAAKAKGEGGEADANYHATDWLQLSAGLSYLDATYVSYNNAEIFTATPGVPGDYGIPGGIKTTSADIGGTPLPRAPKYTAFLGETLEMPLSANYVGKLNSVVRYSSSYAFDPDSGGPLQFDRQPTTTIANLTASVGPRSEAYEIGFYVDNLTNRLYYNQRTTFSEGPVNYPAPGRTYGARVRVKF
jgi:iron complex outermembrane recepter protein